MAAGAAFLRQASFKNYSLLAGELHTYNLYPENYATERHRTRFPLKRQPGQSIRCQTQKEESDGLNTTDDKQSTLLDKLQVKRERDDDDATSSKYNVDCHVQVISWRERHITAKIIIDASPQRVWQVLTDYEQLSEFIPNLVCSEMIPCPYPGRIWLLQRGMQRMMYWNIEAHVILDLKEFPLLGELHFFMVDGDFKRYDGKWCLQAGSRSSTTLLQYEVNVVPKVIFPTAFVENIIKADLPKNLCAIAKRAEAEQDNKLSKVSNKHVTLQAVHTDSKVEVRANVNMGGADLQWSGIGRTCRLDNHCMVDEIHFRRLDDLLENGGVHRQVVASITVKASSKDVWSVLTEYEALPEFVPNLANSMVLLREGKRVRLLQEGCKCLLYMVLHARVILELWEQPEQEISFKQVEGDFDSFEGTWTLNQLGGEHTVLKYTVDTKIWKDCILAESLVEEVIYEDLPSNLCAIRDRVESLANGQSSYSLEISDSSSLSEFEVPCGELELTKCEDTEIERESDQDANMLSDLPTDPPMKPVKDRTLIKGLMSDYGVMEREIRDFIAAYGREGVMPMRKALRQHGRTDLEKAIRAMGGFTTVAARMKLSLAYKERKPAGYWDDVRNLQNEVIAVQKELGCDPKVLPSRLSIERLGKFSLARALEKWGGAKETARILGLKAKGSKKQECHPKERAAKNSGLAPLVKPVLVDPATLSNPIIDQAGTPMKKSLKTEIVGVLSPETYLRAVASFIEEASELPPRKGEASLSQNTTQDSSQQTSTKAMYNPSTNNKDSFERSGESFSASQVKDKKMPYKTGVPQESSKWLTLFADAEQPDAGEE